MRKLIISISIIYSLIISMCNQAMPYDAHIYVAGRGLVGSALVRSLKQKRYTRIINPSSIELDLRRQDAVEKFFNDYKPEYVFLAAAKVGGIGANWNYPAEFIYDNLIIEANVIHAAYKYGVKKLLFLGSSCIYPRECAQPIGEEYLLTGPLEITNKPYALAKIAGIELCQAYNRQYNTHFITCMPTNLYGPYDTFDAHRSHVIPALIAKIYQAHRTGAQEVVLWGTGTPRREFLYVEDLAEAALFLMNTYNGQEIVNVGMGTDITIYELALLIKNLIGYTGNLVFDTRQPDGTPRKLLSVEKIHQLGWRATTPLEEGLKKTITWFIENHTNKH